MKSSLRKRTFNKVTHGWRAMDDKELWHAIDSAKAWADWPGEIEIIKTMQREAIDRFVAKYGTELDGHAILAPSAAHEWAFCSGSLLERLKKGDTAGIDAAMGTVAHAIAEQWNKTGEEPRHLIGTKQSAMAGGKCYEFDIDESWIDDARRFVEWCAEVPGDHFYETKVDLSSFLALPGQRGTTDHAACAPGVLTITDLKNGMVRVRAEKNPQAMLYAAGVFVLYDWIYGFQRIVIRICHPRLDIYDVWECSRQELLDFMEWIHARSLLALRPSAPRTPSEKACRYCGGRATCAARALAIEDTADRMEADSDDEKATFSAEQVTQAAERIEQKGLVLPTLDTTRPKELSTLALEVIHLQRKTIEAFLKSVYEELMRRAENGQTLKHHFLGVGRTTYDWIDEESNAIDISLEYGVPIDKIRPPAMLSFDQMTKLIKAETKLKPKHIKAFLLHLLTKFSGKRNLLRLGEDRVDASDDAEAKLGGVDYDYEL